MTALIILALRADRWAADRLTRVLRDQARVEWAAERRWPE